MIQVVRSDDAPARDGAADCAAEAALGADVLVVGSDAEERQAKRVATVIDAIRSAR